MYKNRFSRRSLFHTFEPFQARRKTDRFISRILAILILLNVFAVILETVPNLKLQYDSLFYVFECFSVAIFTIEYFFRVWAIAEKAPDRPIKTRIEYILSPLAIIDLLTILPFYLPIIAKFDLRTLRLLRLLRLARVFKLGRYSKSLQSLGAVLKHKTPDLAVSISVGLMLIVISASIMYFFENEAQPEVFSSIPAAMWWAVATLTTVGYGDVYPITVGGKIFGSIIAVLGVGLIALPAGILGAGLIESVKKVRVPNSSCPYCGQENSSLDEKVA